MQARISGHEVKVHRKRLKMTQAEYALFTGIPVGTLRNWEQERDQPETPAQLLLRVVFSNPVAVGKALGTLHLLKNTGLDLEGTA